MNATFAEHDHASCVERSLAAAEAHCARVRARLTPARRRTLELLLGEHRGFGAHEVLGA